MTDYQTNKISELLNVGWSHSGSMLSGYIYLMSNSAGIMAYVYPNHIQFIA